MIHRYRKKPVTVEAVVWTGNNLIEIQKFCSPRQADLSRDHIGSGGLFIETLEGVHEAQIGDYIIKGVKGECYPCKPDIFAETYDEVSE